MELEQYLGRRVTLPIGRIGEHAAFLGDEDTILLPGNELPRGAQVGTELEVFVYLDSEERPCATVHPPAIQIGEVAFLEFTDVQEIGAFVDWGLGKELFVPHAEQSREVFPGERHPIGLYLDKSGRLAGTMFVNDLLGPVNRRVGPGEWIDGVAWRNDPDIGLFAILERAFVGLVPAAEPHRLTRGEPAKFRIAHILPDGKLVLSLRDEAYKERDTDAAVILGMLAKSETPPVGDRSAPELIRDLFGLSKKAFKRAVGGLLKAGKVTLDDAGIVRLVR